MIEPNEHVQACPECGRLFKAYGPSSLYITIGNHLHDEHNYPSRFWNPNNSGPSNWPLPFEPKAQPEAFGYMTDENGLTARDRQFLHAMHVAWKAPAGYRADKP